MRVVVFIFLSLFTSCSLENKPSQKEIANLYVDILVAEETYKTDIDRMNIAVDSLYKVHGITKDLYLTTLTEYQFSEKTWDDFFVFAQEYLDTLKAVESRK